MASRFSSLEGHAAHEEEASTLRDVHVVYAAAESIEVDKLEPPRVAFGQAIQVDGDGVAGPIQMDRVDIRIRPDIEEGNDIEAGRQIHGQGLDAVRIDDIEIRAGGRRDREQKPSRYDQKGQAAHDG